jgi:pimeloyl-ACP methyl ester carboxylesterase
VKHKKRREILDLGFALLQHLLLDDQCERIVVVGHSLGTAIAYDTLLQAGRYNRARVNALNLEKIEAFITLGSPLDKIHWFFESYQSRCFRYRKVVEELRGDIGTPPFAASGIPRIYWLNLWDKADPISGSLETPSSDTSLEIRIDNYHVNFRSLNPSSCHCGYFKDPTVLDLLSKIIFERHNPYRHREENFGFLGPGKFAKIPNLPTYLFITLTWAAILALSIWLF